MKLELKHLAPYLPYGVHLMNNYGRWHNTTLHKSISIYMMLEMKPILRPLSDLTKLGSNERWWRDKIALGITKLDYESIQELLEEHYDVFGLIEEGLAIDINTLKE